MDRLGARLSTARFGKNSRRVGSTLLPRRALIALSDISEMSRIFFFFPEYSRDPRTRLSIILPISNISPMMRMGTYLNIAAKRILFVARSFDLLPLSPGYFRRAPCDEGSVYLVVQAHTRAIHVPRYIPWRVPRPGIPYHLGRREGNETWGRRVVVMVTEHTLGYR